MYKVRPLPPVKGSRDATDMTAKRKMRKIYFIILPSTKCSAVNVCELITTPSTNTVVRPVFIGAGFNSFGVHIYTKYLLQRIESRRFEIIIIYVRGYII